MESGESPRITLNSDLLWDLGYQSLTRSQVTDLLGELYETLELRVGTRLAEGMDSNQLARFERIVSRRDESEALKWLGENVPHYKAIVASEWEYILGTLRRASDAKRVSASDRSDVGEPEGVIGLS